MGEMQRIKRACKEYGGKARLKVLKNKAGPVSEIRLFEWTLRAGIATKAAMRAVPAITRKTSDLLGRTPEWEAQSGELLAILSAYRSKQPPA